MYTDGQDHGMMATASSGMLDEMMRDQGHAQHEPRMSVSPQPMGVISVPTSRIGASNRDDRGVFRMGSSGPGQSMQEKTPPLVSS